MNYLESDKNGIAYPMNTVSDAMRDWMNQVEGNTVQIGEISHPDRNEKLWEWKFKPIFNIGNSKLGLEPPIGKLFYMDFVYGDGQVHLKTNRKRITLHFNWMEEVNYGTYIE